MFSNMAISRLSLLPPEEGVNRIVAVRASGEFLEAKVVNVEKPAFLEWFRTEPEFDFIRRDRAGDLTPALGAIASYNSLLAAIGGSRGYVRARLGLAQKGDTNAAPTTDDPAASSDSIRRFSWSGSWRV